METGNSILQGSEEEVRGAIQAFEEILEAMPNDRVALETLFEGYLMLEKSDKAAEYLARLAETILEENDTAALQSLLPALHQHSGLNTDVAEILNQAEAQISSSPPVKSNSSGTGTKSTGSRSKNINGHVAELGNDITAELSMAWNIHQAGEISEEEYAAVVHDLSELSSRQLDTPVTVLHVLEDRHSASLDKVIHFVVRDTNTPFIKLSRFDLDPAAINIRLPEAMVRCRGAIVYETMAKDAMVAILNPYDLELMEKVRKILDTTCHFFLTSSNEYDQALNKLYSASPEESSATQEPAPGQEEIAKPLGLRLKN